MTQLSQYFTLKELTDSETAERNGLKNQPNAAQLERLKNTAQRMDEIREALGHPVIVTSGLRVLAVNRLVPSGDTSAHVTGDAVDFKCPGFGTPAEICRFIVAKGFKFDQLIYEGSWVHISFAPAMRQDVRTAVFRRGQKTQYPKGILA